MACTGRQISGTSYEPPKRSAEGDGLRKQIIVVADPRRAYLLGVTPSKELPVRLIRQVLRCTWQEKRHPNGRPDPSPHPFCGMQIGNFLSRRACRKLCQTALKLHEAAATLEEAREWQTYQNC